MERNIDSNKYVKQVNELCEQALAETIDLLKNSEKGRYIALANWEDEVSAVSYDDVPISIWGVGVNDEETKQMIYDYYKKRQDFLNELINNEPINETFKYKRFKTSEEKYKAIVDYFIMLVNEEQLYEFTPYMFKQFKIALSELKKIVLNKDSNNLRNIRITYSEGCKLLKHITKTSIIL